MPEKKKKAEPEEHVRALARIWRRKKPAGSEPAVKKKRKGPAESTA